MSSSSELTRLELAAFVERVAGPDPTPGGGSVAATLGALGAGLASMAFRVAAGEGRSPVPAYMGARADELDELRAALVAGVDADASAYAAWRAAGQDARAAERALEVPIETMERAVAALRLLAAGSHAVPERLRSECSAAAIALRAAVDAAGVIAADNLSSFEDEGFRSERGATLDTLRARAAELLREVEVRDGAEGGA